MKTKSGRGKPGARRAWLLAVPIACAALLVGVCSMREDPYERLGEGVQTGDIVSFGAYGGGPLAWIVLDVDGESALLVTKDLLATKDLLGRGTTEGRAYHKVPVDVSCEGCTLRCCKARQPITLPAPVDVSWEGCTLRAWLNTEFIDAFPPSDRARILPTYTDEAQTVEDRAFLLSEDEARRYFPHFDDWFVPGMRHGKHLTGYPWWLRGMEPSRYPPFVNVAGFVRDISKYDHWYDIVLPSLPVGVRPAMWVSLSGGSPSTA